MLFFATVLLFSFGKLVVLLSHNLANTEREKHTLTLSLSLCTSARSLHVYVSTRLRHIKFSSLTLFVKRCARALTKCHAIVNFAKSDIYRIIFYVCESTTNTRETRTRYSRLLAIHNRGNNTQRERWREREKGIIPLHNWHLHFHFHFLVEKFHIYIFRIDCSYF